jgi:hypothetical protein
MGKATLINSNWYLKKYPELAFTPSQTPLQVTILALTASICGLYGILQIFPLHHRVLSTSQVEDAIP